MCDPVSGRCGLPGTRLWAVDHGLRHAAKGLWIFEYGRLLATQLAER
jgi:hypothetical protein